jgi:hypothetical protein
VGGAENKEQLRQNRLKREREANMAMVKTPSKATTAVAKAKAMGRQAAADPKAKRPAKPQKAPTTSKVAAPKAKTKKDPRFRFGEDYGPEKALRRNTITKEGKTLANVTKEQLRDSGMTLRQYLNFMDREGKRPPKKAMRGGMMKSKMKAKGMKAGGKMKAKGYKAGGKMKTKGYMAGGKMKAKGMKAGGKMPMAKDPKTGKMVPEFAIDGKGKMMGGGKVKSKGYKAGGKMKAKGGAVGGKKRATKQKVRGAGIARKGVRPAKMR